MRFDKSFTGFPSHVQKRIYVTALQQTPLDVSLACTDGVDPALLESCKAYHSFITSMLSDMYENSLEYGMNTGVYDTFLDGRKENGVKRRFPSKTLELRSKTYNCVHGYLRLLLELAKAGTPSGTGLCINHEDYSRIKLIFDSQLSHKAKSIFNDIPYQTRLNALKRTGLLIAETEGGAVVTHEEHSDMFAAMSALAKSADSVTTFGKQGFYNCEFRQIWNRHTPNFDDVFQPLEEDRKNIIHELDDYLLGIKARQSITTFWKVNYKYRGSQLCCLSLNNTESEVRITGTYFWNNVSNLFEKLDTQSDEFKKYVLRHLNYCTGCSTSHDGGTFIEIFNKRKRVCGAIGLRVHNPSRNDIPYIKQYMDIVVQMLNENGGR